jgi:hypothetical protein
MSKAAWATLGFKLVMAIPSAIAAVEQLKKSFSGDQKEEAAAEFAKFTVETSELVADKDLLNDPAVDAAVRNAIKATVALQNVVAAAKAARVK